MGICFAKKEKPTKVVSPKLCVEKIDMADYEQPNESDLIVLHDQSTRIHHIADVLATIQDKVDQMEIVIDEQILLKTPILRLRKISNKQCKKLKEE